MQTVTLTRRRGDPAKPTISDLVCDDLTLVVLERPRKPDPKDYSKDGKPHPCLTPGEGLVNWTEYVHPLHPFCYQVVTGPGTTWEDRSDILWHTANWIRELMGCLAPGLKAEVVQGTYEGVAVKEFGVSSSHAALQQLHDKLCRKSFKLVIKEA